MDVRIWPCLVLALILGPFAGSASAQLPQPAAPVDGVKSPAEQLFDRGLKEMLAGRYHNGCPALAESYKMDPLPGALFTLAECEAGWGRIATALGHYQQYLSQYERMAADLQQRQTERVEIARSKVAALTDRVPRLTLALARDLPPGTVIRRDGEAIPDTLLGVAMPMDPGSHQITIEAPGRSPKVLSVTMDAGKQQELVIRLEQEERKATSDGDAWRTAAYVTGGVGVAALLGSFIAGGVTLGHKSTIEDNCVDVVCNADGLAAADAASSTGTIADVAFTVGIVATATALTLYLLAPASADSAEPAAEAGVALRPLADVALSRDRLGAVQPHFSIGLEGSF